jgi:hypothetical protein
MGRRCLHKADPKQVAQPLRWIGGFAALLLAGFLLFRGAIAVGQQSHVR